jgi:hypothetical protein
VKGSPTTTRERGKWTGSTPLLDQRLPELHHQAQLHHQQGARRRDFITLRHLVHVARARFLRNTVVSSTKESGKFGGLPGHILQPGHRARHGLPISESIGATRLGPRWLAVAASGAASAVRWSVLTALAATRALKLLVHPVRGPAFPSALVDPLAVDAVAPDWSLRVPGRSPVSTCS